MDIRTLTFVNLLFLLLYAAITALYSHVYGKVRGSSWFALSNLSRGLAWLLLSLTPSLPRLLSTIAGDVLLVVGLVFLHRSLAEVLGRAKLGWKLQLGVAAGVLLGICYLTVVWGSYPAALTLISIALAVQLALTTALLLSGLTSGLRGGVWFTGGILFVYALIEMTRGIALMHSPAGVVGVSATLEAVLLIGMLLANGGTAFGFMFLSAAQLRRELTRLAEHDALTGLLNRRGLKALADRTLRASHREAEPVSAIMLDLDGMKSANDTWGHETGDTMLCSVARLLARTVGERGSVARLGGDEFLILLPGMAEGGACEVAEALRHGIERLRVARCQPRASFGVACTSGAEWEEAVRQSDQALNQAKSGGRNRVVPYAERASRTFLSGQRPIAVSC